MQFPWFRLCLSGSLCILAGSAFAEPPEIEGDKIAFELSDEAGRRVSLSDKRFKDQVVLVDLWGTWCPPCRKAIPFLVDLHERFHPDGFEIVGIAFEDGEDSEARRKTMREYADANNIAYTILDGEGNSPDQAMKVLPALTAVYGLPTMFIVGRHGTVKNSHTGFTSFDKVVIEEEVKKVLRTEHAPVGETPCEK